MMAVVGFAAVDLGLRVYPTPEAYEGLTSVTAHDALVEQGAMGQMLLWFSLAEVLDSIAVVQMLQGSGREPGYFGLDPLKFMNTSKEKQDEWKLKELTNGRLAMMAFSGMVRRSRGQLLLLLTPRRAHAFGWQSRRPASFRQSLSLTHLLSPSFSLSFATCSANTR
jgi:hypothetical protein